MRVAIYTRVSTEDQAREGFSLKVQKEFLLDFVKNHIKGTVFCSLPQAEIYEDDGYSGGTMDRPAIQRLLFDARNKKFDVLLVYKQDRLSRKLKDLLSLLEELDDLGIGFRSATEPVDTTTSAGKMTIQMLGSYAEFERNRLKERVFPGMVAGVKQGHWMGSRFAPYGYTHNKETKKLEVNKEEAKLVKEIFEMYLRGKSTSQIAAHYYRLGVKSRSGGKFYTKFVRDVLRNKVYLGTLVWNKQRYNCKEKTHDGKGKGYKTEKNDPAQVIEVPNAHEPIIKQKDFDEVQRMLQRNNRQKAVKFKNNIYCLSGVLRCNVCEGTYRGKMVISNKAKQEKKPWYYCSSHGQYYTKCNNKAVTAEKIEAQVWAIVEKVSQNLHVLEELGDLIKMSVSEPEDCYKEQLAEKNSRLAKNVEKQKGLYELFSEDKINLDLYKDKAESLRIEEKRLRSEIKLMHMKILEKQNSLNVMKETQDFLDGLRNSSKTEQSDYLIKTFMRILFKSIYLQDQEIVKVELNQPWKLCYEEGLKWKTKNIKAPRSRKKTENQSLKEPSFWRPTAAK